MSGSAGDDLDPVTMARKRERYEYLLPPTSERMIKKMESGCACYAPDDRAPGARSR